MGDRHLIDELRFETDLDQEASRQPPWDDWPGLCRDRLAAVIDRVFDQFSPGDAMVHRLDRLEVDLGVLPDSTTVEDLETRLEEVLRRQLADSFRLGDGDDAVRSETVPAAMAELEQLAFYLEQGFLPWNTRTSAAWDLEQAVGRQAGMHGPLLAALLAQEGPALERLIRQLPDPALARTLSALAPRREKAGFGEWLAGVQRQAASQSRPKARFEAWRTAFLRALVTGEEPPVVGTVDHSGQAPEAESIQKRTGPAPANHAGDRDPALPSEPATAPERRSGEAISGTAAARPEIADQASEERRPGADSRPLPGQSSPPSPQADRDGLTAQEDRSAPPFPAPARPAADQPEALRTPQAAGSPASTAQDSGAVSPATTPGPAGNRGPEHGAPGRDDLPAADGIKGSAAPAPASEPLPPVTEPPPAATPPSPLPVPGTGPTLPATADRPAPSPSRRPSPAAARDGKATAEVAPGGDEVLSASCPLAPIPNATRETTPAAVSGQGAHGEERRPLRALSSDALPRPAAELSRLSAALPPAAVAEPDTPALGPASGVEETMAMAPGRPRPVDGIVSAQPGAAPAAGRQEKNPAPAGIDGPLASTVFGPANATDAAPPAPGLSRQPPAATHGRPATESAEPALPAPPSEARKSVPTVQEPSRPADGILPTQPGAAPAAGRQEEACARAGIDSFQAPTSPESAHLSDASHPVPGLSRPPDPSVAPGRQAGGIPAVTAADTPAQAGEVLAPEAGPGASMRTTEGPGAALGRTTNSPARTTEPSSGAAPTAGPALSIRQEAGELPAALPEQGSGPGGQPTGTPLPPWGPSGRRAPEAGPGMAAADSARKPGGPAAPGRAPAMPASPPGLSDPEGPSDSRLELALPDTLPPLSREKGPNPSATALPPPESIPSPEGGSPLAVGTDNDRQGQGDSPQGRVQGTVAKAPAAPPIPASAAGPDGGGTADGGTGSAPLRDGRIPGVEAETPVPAVHPAAATPAGEDFPAAASTPSAARSHAAAPSDPAAGDEEEELRAQVLARVEGLLAEAVQRHAAQAAQPARYYRRVLAALAGEEPIDLAALAAERDPPPETEDPSQTAQPISTDENPRPMPSASPTPAPEPIPEPIPELATETSPEIASEPASEPASGTTSGTTSGAAPSAAAGPVPPQSLPDAAEPAGAGTPLADLPSQGWVEQSLAVGWNGLGLVLMPLLAEPAQVARLVEAWPDDLLARLLARLRQDDFARLQPYADALTAACPGESTETRRRHWRFLAAALFPAVRFASPAAFVAAYADHLAACFSGQAAFRADLCARLPDRPESKILRQHIRYWLQGSGPAPQPAAAAADPAPLLPGVGLFVPNAGQVLAAPYLQRLFGMLELVAEGRFGDEEKAGRACHLLQFMVDTRSAAPEHELVLNKLLCGMDLRQPLEGGIEVSDRERGTIEGLLKSMIANWSILGNTSVAGLRETFLQRQGVLHFENDAWQLKVESKGVDVLLDRLPWSFSVIRYPWMAHPVMVEWR